MVSVEYALSPLVHTEEVEHLLVEGCTDEESTLLKDIVEFVRPEYGGKALHTGESKFRHVIGTAVNLARLKCDMVIRAASLLYLMPIDPDIDREITTRFGEDVYELTRKVTRMHRLRPYTREIFQSVANDPKARQEYLNRLSKIDNNVLHKILLGTAEDFRVVLIRLASRTQTMRFIARTDREDLFGFAFETQEVYAPLANRLGLGEFKWELEDYTLRILHPDVYKDIAHSIGETRAQREQFIAESVERVKNALKKARIEAEVYGRPKHINSIYNKMRRKHLKFDQLYDIRALRVMVNTIEECYTALDIVHHLWTPIPEEFDDYIQNPKANNYQSLHTAVRCADGRPLEVQIRTYKMHQHAEQGVAAHWRYKEGGSITKQDDKIQLLRQLLQWQQELLDHKDEEGAPEQAGDLSQALKLAGFDQTIYVLTPQGQVIDLPQGATPLDFAYHLHTDLGHRCRGAKVNGAIVPLNQPLQMLQQVEIIAPQQGGGPSRDWLNPNLKYLTTSHAKAKVRQWFKRQEMQRNLMDGRSIIYREMQREGVTGANLDTIASRMGYANQNELFLASRREEFSFRALRAALHGEPVDKLDTPETTIDLSIFSANASKSANQSNTKILVDGVTGLVTHLAQCCKPVPPDQIVGFVSQGKGGITVHRIDCASFAHIAKLYPERVIDAQWGDDKQTKFIVDAQIETDDRKGLVRDIVDAMSKLRISIMGMTTTQHDGITLIRVSLSVSNIDAFNHAMHVLTTLEGVSKAGRA